MAQQHINTASGGDSVKQGFDKTENNFNDLYPRVTKLEGAGSGALPDGWVSVKDQGATGNDSVNDAPAIQAAINSAQANGGVVYFPPGTYKLNSALTITSPVALVGHGSIRSSVLHLADGVNDYILKLSPSAETSYVIPGGLISGLKFDANHFNQTSGPSGCIYMPGAVHWSIDRCHFTLFRDIGVRLTMVSGQQFGHHNRVTRCLFDKASSSAGNGIGLQMDSSDENYVAFNDFENCGGSGSAPQAIRDWSGINTIISNVFVGGEEGIRCQDASGTRISANMFDGVGREAIFISGSQITVSGNTFSGGSKSAAGSYAAITLDSGGSGSSNTITDNVFSTPMGSGTLRSFIREWTTNHNVYSGNAFVATVAPSQAPIEKATGSASKVFGNTYSGVSASAYEGSSLPPGWVNVQDYGAVANGGSGSPADNTNAFLAAADALGSSGGTILIPPGQYYIASTIPLNTADRLKTRWVGGGIKNQTILRFGGAYGFDVNIGSLSAVNAPEFHNLYMVRYSGGRAAQAIRVLGVNHTVIRTCLIEGFNIGVSYDAGVVGGSSYHVLGPGCRLRDNGVAIQMSGTEGGLELYGCHVIHNVVDGDVGLQVLGASWQTRVVGTKFEGVSNAGNGRGTAIELTDTKLATFQNVQIESPAIGINLKGTAKQNYFQGVISNGGDGMKAISCESTTLNNVFEVELLRTSNDPIDDASNRNLYRRPFTNRQGVSSDRGNNSVTLTYLDSPTQYFNTALTAARAVTLPTMDLSKNHRFRVVRGANASGAFNLTVTDGTTTFKALTAASQWCEVEWDGSAWRLTANGSL